MEIWKKGGGGAGGERSGTEREGGVVPVVGATKGGTETPSLTFSRRRAERRVPEFESLEVAPCFRTAINIEVEGVDECAR